ncbi:Glycosyl transferase, family 2 [Granulicella sibirica]|uniref:Glycosyl transferase, family 2 n=2 Tax=Granulicella sibirica TaxID=2479048 RepID=A0A4Q0T9L4_9BACT|nr:Glycosyl transferase, family 2 [Granulicella sibirica]
MMMEAKSASIIIPTFNGASRIGNCLTALLDQTAGRDIEILVIDDGSKDETGDVVRRYPTVRLISRANAGPAAARNLGAFEARGEILLFTDDDCIPMTGWLDAMLTPFESREVVGVKGTYCTRQRELAARFVQVEYEDKYRLMADLPSIDFVDTYSAGFRRENFLEMNGYDTSFPVACAEDVELSYRMSARGWKMVFAPKAVVCHTHPDSFSRYLKKKYKFAFWRVLAVRKNPSKGVKDSHTPQVMKLQLLFAPALVTAAVFDLIVRPAVPATAIVLGAFVLSTLPFAARAFAKDPLIGMLSPAILAARACAQLFGVVAGVMFAGRRQAEVATNPR